MITNPDHMPILTRLIRAFPPSANQQPISDETLTIYAESLADMPTEALAAVVLDIIATNTWFPRVGEIRERWFALFERAMQWPSASQSLAMCLRTVNQTGSGLYDPDSGRLRQPEEWPDPLTAETVRLFGWDRLCNGDQFRLDNDWSKAHDQARENLRGRFASGGPAAMALGHPTRRELAAVIGQPRATEALTA